MGYQRFFLYLLWIGMSFSVIYLNSRYYPSYNSHTANLLITLLLLINTSSIFTKLIGINEKVRVIENEERKKEFLKKNRERINSMKRLYNFQISQEKQKITGDEATKQYFELTEAAKKSWKNKIKSEQNLFEREQYLLHKICRLDDLTSLTLLLMSLMTALYVLNVRVITWPIILSLLVFVCILVGMSLFKRNFISQHQMIKQEIYPDILKN